MESIVLHSDIARLVFGYLINNNLKRAALALSRSSPHLQQEFVALRQGLQPHNFLNGGLEDMIREHVKITGLVANAVHKLPSERRQRLQQLKLSDCVNELLVNKKSELASARDNACQRNENNHPKRKRRYNMRTVLSDEELSTSPSATHPVSNKRPRLLAPHLNCSIDRSLRRNQSIDNASVNSSSASDATSGHTDEDAMHFHGHGPGPKNNSTPRTINSDEIDLMMPTPQTMPELTQAIMTNEDFQAKLLNNINMALQSVHVNAPTPASINAEAVLDGLVKNILEATEKDPSFDRIIQEVVGQDMPPAEPVQTGSTSVCIPDAAPQPPQTPLIIRTAVASANASNATADGNAGNGNGNAIIQLNANNSIGTLIDPNFSISKLIVLNSNESAQKQQLLQPPTVNLSFSSENLINFVEGAGGNLTEADAVANAAAVAAASGSQVCVDATNGQLTFPMILSNEGLLSHLPFLVNNEWLAQQLRSDAFANADVSHIEIPLPEPITVTANQLPPNSIIINSAVKQPPPPATAEPPAQLIADPPKPTVSTVANAAQLERSSGKVTSCNAVPASLDSSRLVLERLTPSTSGIVNVKAFRSLSTPRKRTSHVRTLNFSPKAVPQVPNTPVSTRRLQQQQQRQQRLQQKHKAQQEAKTVEEAKPKELKADEQQQQPVCIKYVEILPNFGNRSASPTKPTGTAASVPATSASCADLSANESNGCVPPLFAMEEGSNQTVIKAVTASKQAKTRATAAAAAGDGSADVTAAAMAPTPKRKQKRRAAAKACKRIISQTAVLDEANTESGNNKSQQEQSIKTEQQQQQKDAKNTSTSLDDSKENKSVDSLMLEVLTDMDEDLMSAWQRQMHGTSTDLEQRLREINAKRQELMQSISRPRRNRVAGKKKSGTPLGPTQKKLPTVASARRKKRKLLQVKKSSNPDGEFKIKIKTPQKSKKPVAVSQEIKEPSEEVIVEKPNEIQEQKEAEKPQEDEEGEPKEASVIKAEETKEQAASEAAAEHREASLSMLFETPFKMTLTEAGEIPPTPGPALMPPLDTPYAKLLPSASFLFGSDTKSILDTPMLTAITPGMRLSTPFGHPLGTPHGSAAKTDYSSGSSYYRPDEAEHTDTNAQCALQPTPKHTRATEERAESAKKSPPTTSFELHAERVPVEPMVLRRVRSFGTEAVDSAEGAVSLPANAEHALPLTETAHYKLVSGLPDAIVDNSSSSSSASSSTFSSSSSSSSSGSSSSDSSAASASAASASSQVPVNATPAKTMQLLDMQNLSDISSTEDEEWVKAAAASGDGPLDAPPLAIDSEPAQLVSQDGEVRYPLRNWLTPSKDAAAAAARAADLNTSGDMAPPAAPAAPQPVVTTTKKSPAKSPTAAKIAQQAVMEQRRQDLAEVRERVKAKVKQQPLPRAKAKKLTTMRETAQLSNPNPNPKALNKSPKKESKVKQESKPEPEMKKPGAADPVKETSNPNKPTASTPSSELDPALLFALNLSAKKQQHHQHPAKVVRVAVEIAAQPAPLKGTGRPRGRPKKLPSAEPVKLAPDCTRRSSRLIDNKTPAPEEPLASGTEASQPTKSLASSVKATKKPAKKRAEARLEPDERSKEPQEQEEQKQPEVQLKPEAQRHEPVVRLERLEEADLPVPTLAEAQTTHKSPERQPKEKSPSPPSVVAPLSPTVSNGGYELSLCTSSSHAANTFRYSYADNGSKPAHPSHSRPPAGYTKNFQMHLMIDQTMHTMRITSPQLLHQSVSSSGEDSASAVSIRNIPKKRIIPITSTSGREEEEQKLAKPQAASTPLAASSSGQRVEPDDNDQEVASINATSTKTNAGKDSLTQPIERSAGVQIEDIESILSCLHGT